MSSQFRKKLQTLKRGVLIKMQRFLNFFGFVYLPKAICLEDGLWVNGRNLEFFEGEKFLESYEVGVNSGHSLGAINVKWRMATICWAVRHASHLKGDFVECGVNTGIASLTGARYIEFEKLKDKTWYLFDTFCGIPEEGLGAQERDKVDLMNRHYFDCFDLVQKNFEDYDNITLVKGVVPESLDSVSIGSVAYLSIDMNLAAPEIAAFRHFWPKLVTGAVVVLDDYGFAGFEEQKEAMDALANEKGVEIFSVPTGQGLLIKP